MWWRIHSGASQSKRPPWGSNLSIIYIVLWGRNRRALIGIGREESESMMLSTSSLLLKLFIHRCSPYAVHTWILPWILLGIWRGCIMSWNKSLYQLLSPKALRVLMWPSKAFFDHSTGLGTAQYVHISLARSGFASQWEREQVKEPLTAQDSYVLSFHLLATHFPMQWRSVAE